MAHFAELDENNIVVNVIKFDDNDMLDSNGNESEEVGIAHLASIFGHDRWAQTSYNANMRGKYAGIGDLWDGENFVTPSAE